MPYCVKCGEYVDKEKKFCGNCGTQNEKYEGAVNQSNIQGTYQREPQQDYYTPYQNNSYNQNFNTPNESDTITSKKKKRALAFSIVTFVCGILSIIAEEFSVFGIIFFIPAIINWAQYRSKSKINEAKLAFIFTIIGGALSSLILMLFL